MVVTLPSTWNLSSLRTPRVIGFIILGVFVSYFLVVTLPPIVSVTDSMVSVPIVEQVCEQAGSSFTAPIPKHIHQMWKDKNLPEEWKAYSDRCRKMNPDYNYTLWSDDEIEKFIEKQYPWFIETYRNYPYRIQRPDSSRYFILYHFGGVYIDVDIDCKVPFSTVFKNATKTTDVILGATAPIGITNNFMAAKPRHPFMQLITSDLVASAKKWFVTPHWTVMMSAGPLYVYRTYIKYPCKDQIHVISVQEHADSFNHEQAATWHSWDGHVMVWLDRHHRAVIFVVIIILIVIFFIGMKRCFLRYFKNKNGNGKATKGNITNGILQNGKKNIL